MIQIDASRCIGCGNCVADCPAHVLSMQEGKAVYSGAPCIECGHCLAICPVAAVSLKRLSKGRPEDQAALPAVAAEMPEQLMNLMTARRSTRQFKRTPLSEEVLAQLMAAAATAPTATNRQPLRYVLLEKDLSKARDLAFEAFAALAKGPMPYGPLFQRMVDAYGAGQDPLFFHAPQVLLVIHPKDSNINDPALAAARVELMAQSMDVGLCFIGFFVTAVAQHAPLRAFLGLRDDEVLALAMAIGRPAVRYHRLVPRRPLHVSRR